MSNCGRLLVTLAPLMLGACAHAPAGGAPPVEVVFQGSTDLIDNGSQINGKLCFDAAHFDRTALANPRGAIDLVGWNRHYVIVPVSPTENLIKGSIASRQDRHSHITFGPGSEEARRNALDAQGGGDGSEDHESVDLRYGADHLIGRVGWHQFMVKAVGDHMEGRYQYNAIAPVYFKLRGMDKMLALPLAEQGVLLPSLLHCLEKFPTHDFELTLADLIRRS